MDIYTEQQKNTINRAERRSSKAKNYIMSMLSREWDKSSMELWKELREIVIKYPTANETIYNNYEIVNELYINCDKDINKYLYAQNGDFDNVIIDFDNDKDVFKSNRRCSNKVISEVSSKDARLSIVLKYPGLKEFFIKNGYATEFKQNKYILSPVLFNNIYKGAIGEITGKFILERELGIILKEIDDEEKFEFFDFMISQDIYVDFKHWKQNYRQDRNDYKKEITKKINKIGAKKVYIINIVEWEEYSRYTQVDERIIEIPALLDTNGNIIRGSLDLLKGEVYNDKNK